jgi:hypothetical protein
MVRLGSIGHLLAVNDIYVRTQRACRDLGWSFKLWQPPDELAPVLGTAARLIPDAYFQVGRDSDGRERTAGFFLELERVAKSSRVLEAKLRRYAEFYYRGHYQEMFGTRALRILVVFATDSRATEIARLQRALDQAQRLGITLARFASLEILRSSSAADLFVAPLWWRPGQDKPSALFAGIERTPASLTDEGE